MAIINSTIFGGGGGIKEGLYTNITAEQSTANSYDDAFFTSNETYPYKQYYIKDSKLILYTGGCYAYFSGWVEMATCDANGITTKAYNPRSKLTSTSSGVCPLYGLVNGEYVVLYTLDQALIATSRYTQSTAKQTKPVTLTESNIILEAGNKLEAKLQPLYVINLNRFAAASGSYRTTQVGTVLVVE